MCLDQNGMEWAHAWMTKTAPPEGKVGFGYMLQGGSDGSNEAPHAIEPAAGDEWVDTGAHVMLFNVCAMAQGYPSQKDDPDTSQPYVMSSCGRARRMSTKRAMARPHHRQARDNARRAATAPAEAT
jgi:hypothetical protein